MGSNLVWCVQVSQKFFFGTVIPRSGAIDSSSPAICFCGAGNLLFSSDDREEARLTPNKRKTDPPLRNRNIRDSSIVPAERGMTVL
jgi:hypothetical protein